MPPKQARRRGTGRGRGGTAVSRARASLPARIDPAPPAVCARARGLRTRRPEFALFPLITCGESARQRDREKETESERKGEREIRTCGRGGLVPKSRGERRPQARFAGPTRAGRPCNGRAFMHAASCMSPKKQEGRRSFDESWVFILGSATAESVCERGSEGEGECAGAGNWRAWSRAGVPEAGRPQCVRE